MNKLALIHDALVINHPSVEGLSQPAADSPISEIVIQFKKGTSKAAMTAARLALDALDGITLPGEIEQKRLEEYQKSLGTPGDQFDAIYKGLEIIIPALVEGRALTAEEASLLVPDKTKPADTPAGWRGKVKEIKERNPKP